MHGVGFRVSLFLQCRFEAGFSLIACSMHLRMVLASFGI